MISGFLPVIGACRLTEQQFSRNSECPENPRNWFGAPSRNPEIPGSSVLILTSSSSAKLWASQLSSGRTQLSTSTARSLTSPTLLAGHTPDDLRAKEHRRVKTTSISTSDPEWLEKTIRYPGSFATARISTRRNRLSGYGYLKTHISMTSSLGSLSTSFWTPTPTIFNMDYESSNIGRWTTTGS
ncbi:hypothetical protein CF319_g7195 [Tilletia indica]|nr:hypothetical protein CF319_g7195 [Tilletia indica]